MTVSAVTRSLQLTRYWLRVQALSAVAISGLAALVAGGIAAYSALFGALAAYLPGLVFALIIARRFGADGATFVRAAVLAESAKWIFCGLICVAVFVGVDPLAAGWFFAGMVIVILAGWLGLILSS